MKNSSVSELKEKLLEADAVVIGAGAGLSTAAGYIYEGERFKQYFSDFEKVYDFHDMYTGGFYPYEKPEILWAYWSRYIYINRYMPMPNDLYDKILDVVKDKDYFVLTTNVDHCFQRAGFEKKRLFYTQGDYGLFQCVTPCHQKTYDNEAVIRKMLLSQGFSFDEEGILILPEGEEISMEIPSYLVPKCPVCGKPLRMNLRDDNHFVEDQGWDRACEKYQNFLDQHDGKKILFLELGVGYNTPGIIKYPFWQMTYKNPNAAYVCINQGQAYLPEEIKDRSLLFDGDIRQIVDLLRTAEDENS